MKMTPTHPVIPLVYLAIEPKSAADQVALLAALAKLAADDPSLLVSTDPGSGQIILNGVSELHLGIKVEALKKTYNMDVVTGALQVAYLEQITDKVTVDYTHKKQTGGSGQFAQVKITAEPIEISRGFVFENEVVVGALPKEYILGVEKGLKSATGAGILAGFPVVGLKVSLIDGNYHEIDSSALAFEIAARMALREGLHRGGTVLLEPIMKVEVETSDKYTHAITKSQI
ncbi:MAG: elongation factor [Acidobacteriaceae bacterium]|jgi:elongation factor G|nr:elongation factor [Acidobacteriaceae bacterium]